jgi:hypothetical protein
MFFFPNIRGGSQPPAGRLERLPGLRSRCQKRQVVKSAGIFSRTEEREFGCSQDGQIAGAREKQNIFKGDCTKKTEPFWSMERLCRLSVKKTSGKIEKTASNPKVS